MQAVVLHGIGDLRIDALPDRSPGPGEVQVRVRYGGICGSDVHYFEHGEAGSSVLSEPLVLGHELAGEISEVGPGVVGLRSGQRVTVSPGTPCRECEECRSGCRHRCERPRYLGSAAHIPHVQGGFRQEFVVSAEQVVPLPGGLPLRRATLTEPLAVALHAVGMLGDVVGSTVLVVGVGPIGLLAVAALRKRGANRIVARDFALPALEMARTVGADAVEIARAGDFSGQVDVALECSGTADGLATALERTRRRGRVVQVGMPSPSSSVDLSRLVTSEIELVGSFRFDGEILEAVGILASRPELEAIVADCFPIQQAREAFSLASEHDRPGKVLLEI